jgi:type I restriction enzyme S subunit
LRLRSGFALPSAQAQRKSLTLIVAESHLDCRAALFSTKRSQEDLPEGWTMGRVGDVFDIVAGNTPSTATALFWGGTHAWATPKDLSKLGAPVLLTPERALTDKGLRACSSGLLPAGTLLLSSRAPIGYLAFTNQPTAINQGIAAFRRKNVSTSFAWMWCRTNMALIKASANGSTFLEISKGVLRQLPMIQGPELVMRAFAEIADPLVERLVAVVKQNVTLAALRDTLLPRLISGELRVRDAETIAADA